MTIGTAYQRTAAGYHPFDAYVAQEAVDAPRTHLLFAPHILRDVTHTKEEQKNGNDFLLRLLSDEPDSEFIRIENKFEQYASGNVALELVSVDRPRLVPGWMFTSKAAWLLSWFPTGEVCCWPMQELREYVLSTAEPSLGTTALNRKYLSWSMLAKIDHLVATLPSARVLDLAQEIGEEPKNSKRLVYSGRALSKKCSSTEFLKLANSMPRASTPHAPSHDEIVKVMQSLNAVNLKRNDPRHRAFLNALPQEWGFFEEVANA